MKKFSTYAKKWEKYFVIVATFGFLALSVTNCKSPTSLNDEGEADIIVYSKIDEVLDIYMDGVMRFSIRYKNTIELDNVSLDTHELEAKKTGTDIILATESIDVTEEANYTWQIEDPADINVENQFGEALKIYMDDEYQFDLVDEEDRWILDVPWGEHLLIALKLSDGIQIASKVINVTEDKDYTWIIEKIK